MKAQRYCDYPGTIRAITEEFLDIRSDAPVCVKVQVVFETEGEAAFRVRLLVLFDTHAGEHGHMVLWLTVVFGSLRICGTCDQDNAGEKRTYD